MRVPLIELDLRLPIEQFNFDRVLFLDIDGVLHPDGPGDYEDFSCIDAFCDVLRSVDPGGKLPIIVSSAWRHTQRLEEIKSNFPLDVGQQIVGVTPDWLESTIASVASDSFPDGAQGSPHKRQDEIVAWVSRNAPRGQWLALDDRAGGFADQCPHLFLVPGTGKDDGGQGITPSVAIDLRKRLDAFLRI